MSSQVLAPAPQEHPACTSSAAGAIWLFLPPPSCATLLCVCPCCWRHSWCPSPWLQALHPGQSWLPVDSLQNGLWALFKVFTGCPWLRWARDTLQWSSKETSILHNDAKKLMLVCIYLTNRIKPYFVLCLLLFLLSICVPPVPLGDPVPLM